jgi:hypothetical protein
VAGTPNDDELLGPALSQWCVAALGARPVEQLFTRSGMAQVVGIRLDDGRAVVIKARADDPARARICLDAQRALHQQGFPCPEPLSGIDLVDGLAVHAESLVPGGDRLLGTGRDVSERFAFLLADLVARVNELGLPPPEPAPIWIAWDHPGRDLWPDDGVHPTRAGESGAPEFVEEIASRVRGRFTHGALPNVIGHGDWETQNMSWRAGKPYAVHDWDSLSWRPEAAIAGAAASTFPSGDQPVLAPLDASAEFLDAYQRARDRTFTLDEIEMAWGAGLWIASHNARMEAIYGKPPLIINALQQEAETRLELAGA